MRTIIEIWAVMSAFEAGFCAHEKPNLMFPAKYFAGCAIGLVFLSIFIWGF